MAAASGLPSRHGDSAVALLHLLLKEVEWIRKLSSRLYRGPNESLHLERDLASILELAGSVAQEMRRFLEDAREVDRRAMPEAPIETLVDEARRRVARRAPAACFTRSVHPRARPVQVPAEALIALVAILENAADFGGDRAPVSIQARIVGGAAEIVVEDRGVGMDTVVLAACRERGFTTRPEQGGCGLGLYSASRVAERCGGSLQVESSSGTGTTVRLRLPIAREPEESPR